MRKPPRWTMALLSFCLVNSWGVTSFAATQETTRCMQFGPYVIQTVTWDMPDLGFPWKSISSASLTYTWDWLPHAAWPMEGAPPQSLVMKSQNAPLPHGQCGLGHFGPYGVTETGQTYYWASVEIVALIEDLETGQQYSCHAYSGANTDAFHNAVTHTIEKTDWIIYPH